MGDIVNLKLERKRKARSEKDERAAQNREKFGRNKSERERTEALKAKAQKDLDGHRRDS